MCAGLDSKKIECLFHQMKLRNLRQIFAWNLTLDRTQKYILGGNSCFPLSLLFEGRKFFFGESFRKTASKLLRVEEDVVDSFYNGFIRKESCPNKKCCVDAYKLGNIYSIK